MNVQKKEEIFTLIEQNRKILQGFGVEKIGLFGSFVRSKQKRESDIDLLVKFQKGKKTYRNFINFAWYLEDLFGRKVEIVTPESLSPYIAPYVASEVKYVQISA